jgi:hypothetical protein
LFEIGRRFLKIFFSETALPKFHIIWPSGFRGKAVLEIEQ